jgi:hypothetical protein
MNPPVPPTRHRAARYLAHVALLATAASCRREQPAPAEPAPAEASAEATAAPIAAEGSAPAAADEPPVDGSAQPEVDPHHAPMVSPEAAGWHKSSALTEEQARMVESAEAQRVALAAMLTQTLVGAIAEGDFVNAIDACKLQAPSLTRDAQRGVEAFSVAVGRTSVRLRNPDNTPPDWVSAAMQTPDPAGVWVGPDVVGTLTPISTGALCTKCHGGPSDLAPGVAERIAVLYPGDQAVGFAEGDLRGWFWTEATPNL